MSKKKACKKCKIFYLEEECPHCHISQPVTNWKGRVYIVDAEKSDIAKQIGSEHDGEYAIKVT